MRKPLTQCELYCYILEFVTGHGNLLNHYRPPEGGRLYDMKVVSGYAFLRTYFV